MRTKNEILLKFLFPQYSQPCESRFLKSFNKTRNKKNKNETETNLYKISLDKIMNGEDKRTTIIIKNIPNNITKENINEILYGVGNFNFLYLPYDKYKKKNLGFAFVNMINYRSIIYLFNKLTNNKFETIEMKNNIEICYSKIQGKVSLRKILEKN